MNLKEVKRITFFNILIYVLIFLCFIISLLAVLIIPAHASELSVQCVSGDFSSCISLSQGNNATTLNTNVVSNYDTFLSYRYVSLTSIPLQPDLKYTFKIYVTPVTTAEIKNIYAHVTYSTIDGPTQTDNVYLSYDVKNSTKYGFTNEFTFTYKTPSFYRNSTVNFINIDFGSSGKKIKMIEIEESDELFTSSILDVAGILSEVVQSTTANMCTNKINIEDINNCSNISGNACLSTITDSSNASGSVNFNFTSGNWRGVATKNYERVNPNTSYHLILEADDYSNAPYYGIVYFFDSMYGLINENTYGFDSSIKNIIVNSPSNAYYVRFAFTATYPGNTSLKNLYFGVNSNYCAFGSYSSKQDEINNNINDLKDLQQQQNDYLMDNTQPLPNNQDLENILGLVDIDDPLSYMLTLPISLINKINVALNSSCSDFILGRFGNVGNVNLGTYEFKFPCIQPSKYLGSSLWAIIDVIMAMGLLAFTISKFYHMISNVLTMGGEETASSLFIYLTPMEFLSTILSGQTPFINVNNIKTY